MKVGFIGLGTMGLPMARCLQHKGFDLLGWDLNPAAIEQLGQAGDSIEQLAEDCEAIVTMLPEGEHVYAVYRQILASNVDAKRLFIDCSTIDIETTRLLASDVKAQGHGFVDAPVSGGSQAAAHGELSFMIGGCEADIEAARPILEAMGSKLTDFGETGAGQAAKACHNMICGITALGVCEAFALADSLDLDLEKFFNLCKGAAAQSWILENRCPVPGPAPAAPASNAYAPGFAARLLAKDLRLAQQAAQASGQNTEFGAEAARRFREFVESSDGNLDFSAIYRSIRQ